MPQPITSLHQTTDLRMLLTIERMRRRLQYYQRAFAVAAMVAALEAAAILTIVLTR
ncbi:MAG: hypothetical protein NZ765_09740 [Anaerolineae bacterium]|nr:hypothetical protein [Anaerolineae bacterium]